MTTYTNIPDEDIDQDSPVTQPLLTALRDNLAATAEGAAGAPRINPIDAMSHNGALRAVGTYAFALTIDTNFSPGSTTSGSLLRFSNANGDVGGSVSVGTWRMMGQASSGVSSEITTLFLRIL